MTITVTTTTWTVLDGRDRGARFTWTEADDAQGRFGVEDRPRHRGRCPESPRHRVVEELRLAV